MSPRERGEIRVDHLTLAFGAKHVLEDICLALPTGGLTLVTGPNGAGKSTLLRCLAGTERFDRGSILSQDTVVDTQASAWHQQVALVPDDNALLPELTTREHLELGCVLADLPPAERRERSAWLLDHFGLVGHRNQRPDELSFGYRKRLAIALSLVQPVSLYLFDEPLVGLDDASLGLFANVLRLLRARGRTVLVASHISEPLARMADCRWYLRDGHVEPGPPQGMPALREADLPWIR